MLNALLLSGGLPTEEAKNEVVILRGSFRDAAERDRLMLRVRQSRNPCDFCRVHHNDRWDGNPDVLRIPLRFDADTNVEFDEDAIILREGDVVLVEARDRDVFYTGGLLPGGAYLLPRDRDTNVLEAIAMAGGSIGGGLGSAGRNGAVVRRRRHRRCIPPSECIIVRSFDRCGSVNIKVNLNRAFQSDAERILIQAGDTIIVRYTTAELLGNIVLSTVNFNFLFNGLQRRQLLIHHGRAGDASPPAFVLQMTFDCTGGIDIPRLPILGTIAFGKEAASTMAGSLRVALVHDWLTGMRGGEKVLEVFCELFPDAPLYTLVHKPGSVSPIIEIARSSRRRCRRFPARLDHYRKFLAADARARRTAAADERRSGAVVEFLRRQKRSERRRRQTRSVTFIRRCGTSTTASTTTSAKDAPAWRCERR